jgi:hypothetical protein
MNATVDIMANADNSKCPEGCFRPVGLALDGKGRLWMSSDASGELYVLAKTGNGTTNGTAKKSGGVSGIDNGAGWWMGSLVVGSLFLVFWGV